ncbi:MAG: response regulator [Salibaculum sp.]|uniref:response regulator n=1 Tax=Salibaculum sp. TaxID=2855480 RepID=UPI0028704213|nr:response regulator [Salibaculum sp.]MDR9427280.1 response regulator [Salibaculum sp.]MDR9481726.1 response regulator [Salibaculum sp.]
MDSLDDIVPNRAPTAKRPLLGLTVLAVEDSRFASEALRLICLRSGARIRRADTLHHARRHLRVYRPSVVLVDMGLPDGSGAGLIAALGRASPRVDVLLGMSGDSDTHDAALKAGADGFLAKPIATLGQFQSVILEHLSEERRPTGLCVLADDRVEPDGIALRDDLAAAADALSGATDRRRLRYLAQFLGGVARSAADTPLSEAVDCLEDLLTTGQSTAHQRDRVAAMVQDRLDRVQVI